MPSKCFLEHFLRFVWSTTSGFPWSFIDISIFVSIVIIHVLYQILGTNYLIHGSRTILKINNDRNNSWGESKVREAL